MKKILYIGNALNNNKTNPSYMFQLGALLEGEGFELTYASSYSNKIVRMLHMISTVLLSKSKIVLIDTYSTQNFYYAYVISQLCRLLKKQYYPILHGGNLPARIKRSKTKCDRIFFNATKNISPSKFLEKSFIKNGYLNTVFIPNTIRIEDYSFKKRGVAKLKVLWVRSFSSIYNPKMALSVLQDLNENDVGASLCMIGPDTDGSMSQLKQLASDHELDVTFTGKLTKKQWIDLAQDFNVFINTTNFDNMPVTVIEAMALGLPIVSTNVGGLPYLIEHKFNALLVEPNNSKAMAREIIEIQNNQALREKLVMNARRKAESFDWSKVREKWLAIFNNY